MLIGVALIVVAFVLLVVGNSVTRSSIRSAYGRLDAETITRAPGTGAVPAWVSFVVMVAWALIAVGIVVTVVTLL